MNVSTNKYAGTAVKGSGMSQDMEYNVALFLLIPLPTRYKQVASPSGMLWRASDRITFEDNSSFDDPAATPMDDPSPRPMILFGA